MPHVVVADIILVNERTAARSDLIYGMMILKTDGGAKVTFSLNSATLCQFI